MAYCFCFFGQKSWRDYLIAPLGCYGNSLCVCVLLFLYVPLHVYVPMCVGQPEGHNWVSFLISLYLPCFQGMGSCWPLALAGCLDQLTSKTQGPSYLCLLHAGIVGMHHHDWLCSGCLNSILFLAGQVLHLMNHLYNPGYRNSCLVLLLSSSDQ